MNSTNFYSDSHKCDKMPRNVWIRHDYNRIGDKSFTYYGWHMFKFDSVGRPIDLGRIHSCPYCEQTLIGGDEK